MKNSLIHFIERTDSTNNYLKREIQRREAENKKIAEFSSIYTDEQTHGRGLATNRWESEKGKNLLVSFYFQPPLPASDQFVFNQFFSLSIKKLLQHYNIPDVKVKWSNDIYVQNHKVAGILIEHFLEGDKISKTIAGVGININQTQFSPSLPNPTSFKIVTGKEYEIRNVLEQLLAILEIEYDILRKGNFTYFQENYLKSMYRFNEKAKYLIDEEEKTCIIKGLDRFGQLILEDAKGNLKSYGYKELKFL